jgi:DNA-binding response OmpR family regulator
MDLSSINVAKTLLLITNSQELQEAYRELFEGERFNVTVIGNTSALFGKENILSSDVIVLDSEAITARVVEFLRRIQDTGKQIPILVLYWSNTPAQRIQLLKQISNVYTANPLTLSMQDFINQINALVQGNFS